MIIRKPVNDLQEENVFNKLKDDYPNKKEIEGTKELIRLLDVKNWRRTDKIKLKR